MAMTDEDKLLRLRDCARELLRLRKSRPEFVTVFLECHFGPFLDNDWQMVRDCAEWKLPIDEWRRDLPRPKPWWRD